MLLFQVNFLPSVTSPRTENKIRSPPLQSTGGMGPHPAGDHDASDVQSSLDAIANDMQKYGSEAQFKAIEAEMMSMDNPGLMKDPNALVDNPDVLPSGGSGQQQNTEHQPATSQAPGAQQVGDSHVLESPISDDENSDVHLSLPPRPSESPTTMNSQQPPQPAYTSPLQEISSPTMRDRNMSLPSIPGRDLPQNNVPPPEYNSATYGPYPGSVESKDREQVMRSQSHPGDVPTDYQHQTSDPNAGYNSMGTNLPPLNNAPQTGPPPPAYDTPVERQGEEAHRRYSDGMPPYARDQNYPPNTEALIPDGRDMHRPYESDYPPHTPSEYPPPTPRSDYPPPTPRSDYPPPTPRSDYGAPPSIDDNHSLPPPARERHPDSNQPATHLSHHGSVDNSPENASNSSTAPAPADSLPVPSTRSSQVPLETTSIGPPPPFYDLPPYGGGSTAGSSSVIRQPPYGYGYPDPLERSRSVLPSLPGTETSQPSLFPPPPMPSLPSRSQDTSLYPTYSDRSFYGQYLPPPIPSVSDRTLPSTTQALPDTQSTTSHTPSTSQTSTSSAADQLPGRDTTATSSASSFNLLRRPEMDRNYSPSQLLGTQMPPPPQTYMGHDDRARHWAQASPLSSLTPGGSLTSKDAYPNLDSYGQKNTAPSFSMPRPEDPMAHLGMDAYFGRHFGSSAANTGYNRQDTYRHPPHMPDYRSFSHQTPAPPSDMFGRVGMNPSSLGLDKYYPYPPNPMYRPQHMGSTPAPFMPPTASNTQKPYGETDYSRTMYGQPSAYSFDKQYLKPSQYFPGAPAHHTAPGQELQDPYRRSVIYNMMDRYY